MAQFGESQANLVPRIGRAVNRRSCCLEVASKPGSSNPWLTVSCPRGYQLNPPRDQRPSARKAISLSALPSVFDAASHPFVGPSPVQPAAPFFRVGEGAIPATLWRVLSRSSLRRQAHGGRAKPRHECLRLLTLNQQPEAARRVPFWFD
jgi:hypothetical protein